MKNALLYFIIILSYTNALQAQTKIWGVGATNGAAEGEFQNAFVDTTVVGSYALNSWTALSIYDTDTIFPGNAYWTRSTLGYSQGAYAGSTPMPSPSQINGVAIFDSDYLDNNGLIAAFGIGSSPSQHRGELISPRIDLSGYTDSSLMVQFFSRYRDYEMDELSISMSVDDGITWSTSIDCRSLQDENIPGFVRVYFPNFTAGISNLSNCRIRFVFEGAYYFVTLDDVSIEVAQSYDLAIARPNPNSPILEERGDYLKIGNNRYLACINLLAYDIEQWYFGLRAVNHGSKDLLPSDFARIRLQIDYTNSITGAITTNIYNDTILLTDTLLSSAQNSIFGYDNLKDINFIFIYGDGTYTAKYWVEHNQMDAYGDNDTIEHHFNNTEYHPLYNYLSKALINSDGKASATSAIFPEEKDLLGYEYGSMYYFPRGYSDGIKIDSVDFRYQVPYNYTGDTTSSVIVRVYQFIDNAPSDGFLSNTNELLHVGLGVMNLTGLGTTTALNRYGFARVSSLVDAATGNPMGDLVDNGYYIITIQQAPFLTGNNVLLDSSKQVWFGVCEYNYAQNMALTSASNIMPHPFITIARDSSQNMSISLEEDRLNMVPSIGIHLSGNFLAHGIPSTSSSTSITLDVYPNPAQDCVMAQADFEGAEAIQYLLTDVSGRIIQIQNQKKATSPQRFNLKKLPAGTYFISAKNKKEATTTTFIKN
jgi:hypothetical protein